MIVFIQENSVIVYMKCHTKSRLLLFCQIEDAMQRFGLEAFSAESIRASRIRMTNHIHTIFKDSEWVYDSILNQFLIFIQSYLLLLATNFLNISFKKYRTWCVCLYGNVASSF